MAFTGISVNERNTASGVRESISNFIATLSPKETPLLDWLGDPPESAAHIKHEYMEDFMPPNTILTSTAINSASSATPISFAINGLGLALNIGQLLNNDSAAPETYQVQSIIGANSITVTRAYNGSAVGSLAVGGTLYVGGPMGVEGADHSGADTRRLGTRQANTLGLFRMEIAESATSLEAGLLSDSYDTRVRKAFTSILYSLENEVIRGKWNAANSLGTATTTRTLKGIKTFLTTINSAITASSFAANPHLYIGDAWEQAWSQGANVGTETWGIVAGSTFFRNLSDLNDTKVSDSNEREEFKRVIRRYTGPFGSAELFLGRTLAATELLLIPRERVRVVNLRNRSFTYDPMAKTGDNQKGLITGEYTLELYHENGMARLYV